MSTMVQGKIAENRLSEDNDLQMENVFSIAPGQPFLQTLAEALVKGELYDGFFPLEDPQKLNECLIFLPTRRAARGLSIEILNTIEKHGNTRATLLPKIRTLGDIDDEEDLFGLINSEQNILKSVINTKKLMPQFQRKLALAQLAKSWVKAMSPETMSLLEHEVILLPSSSSEALYLANDLEQFMDQVETEGTSWEAIKNITPQDHAQWWQLTLSFLDIVMTRWPEYLQANNMINPSQFRNYITDFRIEELTRSPVAGPIIAAGSTGSVPTTTRLLKFIKRQKNGIIVLPGLDLRLPSPIIKNIQKENEFSSTSVTSTHSQYGLIKLLAALNTSIENVRSIGEKQSYLTAREEIINLSLLPAENSDLWIKNKSEFDSKQVVEAFKNVTLIEAANEQQEALAIALVLRKALEQPNKTAALITPDRTLARRVSAELERFNIQIDDSAGIAVSNSNAGLLLRNLLRSIFNSNDLVSISNLLKSDLLRVGNSKEKANKLGQLLELILVRNSIQKLEFHCLVELLDEAQKKCADQTHTPNMIKILSEDDWDELKIFASEITNHVMPLVKLADNENEIHPSALFDLLLNSAIELSKDETGKSLFMLAEGAEELLRLKDELAVAKNIDFNIFNQECVPVLDAILNDIKIRTAGRTHSRLHIYGALEARLQKSDMVVLGGLNEGIWPQSTKNDPFLNRPMRSTLSLPLPERRIGLSAHDFSQFSGTEEVYYTRSKRVNDTPAIASRWIQRLKALLTDDLVGQISKRGEIFIHLTKQIDRAKGPRMIGRPPTVKPPISARPTSLSITEIETWIRDPYAIYAKHILKLHPLPPIIHEADPALRGTIFHNILAEFVSTWNGNNFAEANKLIKTIIDREFALQFIPPEIVTSWKPRFYKIAEAFLNWELDRKEILESFCEISVNSEIGQTGFKLRGRADRIDIMQDGRLSIVDYKTGNNPTAKQARVLSPQLSLEAALAKRGEFSGISSASIDQLLYIRLKEKNDFKIDNILTQKKGSETQNPDEFVELVYQKLIDHITAYQDPNQAYTSRYAPTSDTNLIGDYNHLARVREWSTGEAEDHDE